MTADRMLTPEEACATVLGHVEPLGIERVALLDASGRVLARDSRLGDAKPLEAPCTENRIPELQCSQWAVAPGCTAA